MTSIGWFEQIEIDLELEWTFLVIFEDAFNLQTVC